MIVLLPGIQAGPAEFARLLPLLPHDSRALALPDSLADRIPDVAAEILAQLPAGAHDFVGASFGGLVATAMPANRVQSLLTIGTLPYRTDAAERSLRASRLIAMFPRWAFRRWYRSRVRQSLGDDGADEELQSSIRLPDRDVLAARLRAIGHWRFPRPAFSATYAWGVTDPWVHWDKGTVQALGFEGVVLPGGHRPHLSHPSEVATWIRSIAANDAP